MGLSQGESTVSLCNYQGFETPYVLMLMDTVGKKDSNLLSNTGKKKVGMECGCIPGFSVGDAKTGFEMVDRLFDHCANFVCLIPLLSSPDSTWEGTQVFHRVDVEHAAAG